MSLVSKVSLQHATWVVKPGVYQKASKNPPIVDFKTDKAENLREVERKEGG